MKAPLREYDKLTVKERQARAILRGELEAKGMLVRKSSTEDFFYPDPDKLVVPKLESEEPEGAPLPVPEQNCRQLAYHGCQEDIICHTWSDAERAAVRAFLMGRRGFVSPAELIEMATTSLQTGAISLEQWREVVDS